MTFFEIHNATVWRGATEALKDFSLELRAGESTAVLGPNGAAKSTFLKLLTGEVRPEANRGTQCRLFGEELWSLEGAAPSHRRGHAGGGHPLRAGGNRR
jgi:ABC-type multidrug transport system ATPase subunit